MDTNHGGSNLDADHPQQGVNVPRLTTTTLAVFIRGGFRALDENEDVHR